MSRALYEAYDKFGVSDIYPYGYASSEAEAMARTLRKCSMPEAIVGMIWLRGRILHLEYENACLVEKMKQVQADAVGRIEAAQIDERAYQALQEIV